MLDETIGNQQATDADIGWLAGIIDGEGHIGISYENGTKVRIGRCDVQIVNCDYAVIEKTVRILRACGVNPYIRQRVHQKKTWSTNWIVTVGRFAQIDKVLTVVKPYLTGQKKAKADLMHRLIKSRMGKTGKSRYDEYELSIVEEFRQRFVGKCGASTTARKAFAQANGRYSLISRESARRRIEESASPS